MEHLYQCIQSKFGKIGPEKLRIWTLFMQCEIHIQGFFIVKHWIGLQDILPWRIFVIFWFQTSYTASPETMRKLCLFTKFPHHEIRWNYGILRSDIFIYVWVRDRISVLYSDLILWLILDICKLVKSLRGFWPITANCYEQLTPNLIWIRLLSVLLDELPIFGAYFRGANF